MEEALVVDSNDCWVMMALRKKVSAVVFFFKLGYIRFWGFWSLVWKLDYEAYTCVQEPFFSVKYFPLKTSYNQENCIWNRKT